MKKSGQILLLGIFAALTAFCAVYFSKTAPHRVILETDMPELAWLQKEFNLGDAEFKRIFELHAAYLPNCIEMCKRIDLQNQRLIQLLQEGTQMTPEIELALGEASKLRSECQRNMLKHFFEVSRIMPPDQGRRYLDWVQARTLQTDNGMPHGK